MARIELRDCVILLKDGLQGGAKINNAMVADGDTSVMIDDVSLNNDDGDLVPVGARFTVDGEMGSPIHVVTARTPADEGPTTQITFSPAFENGVADDADIVFLPQQIEVKIGDGNLTYTENKEYEYLLDRGDLDTVREGNQVPMDVTIDFVYEFVRTGTNENITPVDALKGRGKAAEWVSASPDPCEPFCVDVVVEHNPPCGSAEMEITEFPEFRYDSLNPDLSAATISVQGRCNATEPIITRKSVD